MNFEPYSTLTFDCYGTLIDWEAGILAALRPILNERHVEASDETLLSLYASLEHRQQAQDSARLYPEILAAVADDLAAHFQCELNDDERQAFAHSVRDWPAFADSQEALQRLQKRFNLIVISNVDWASFRQSEQRLGIDFDHVITAEDTGYWKPDPRMFTEAFGRIHALGAAQPQCLHVAQSLFHDHLPAKNMGLSTVWVDRRGGREGSGATPAVPPEEVMPDLRVETLAELADLVEATEA